MKERVTRVLKNINKDYLLEDETLSIDSHDIFNIIVGLEKEFDIEIDPTYLKADNFKNIDSITKMIEAIKNV